MAERIAKDVVVVTGVGGMGVAVARRLGSGRTLVLADAAPTLLARVATALRDEGHEVHEVVTDVSNVDGVAALAATAAGLGRVWAVVHTAGLSPVQSSADRIIDVDLIGTALVLDAFEPHAGSDTVAVCIASMAGTRALLGPEDERALATTPTASLADLAVVSQARSDPGAAYGIAKRGVQLRVQGAAISWGRRGARVVSVSPGIIATPMGREELAGSSGDMMREMVAVSPAKRLGTPEDIADAVAFLVSPAASFITGSDLLVDGGVVAALRHGA